MQQKGQVFCFLLLVDGFLIVKELRRSGAGLIHTEAYPVGGKAGGKLVMPVCLPGSQFKRVIWYPLPVTQKIHFHIDPDRLLCLAVEMQTLGIIAGHQVGV